MQPSTAARNPEHVRALAEDIGVLIVGEQPQLDGSTAIRIECPTQQSKIDLLHELGRYDAWWFPDMTRIARQIVSGCGPDDHARLEAIQRYVQTHVGFCEEEQETFPSALQVLLDGIGDCDDHSLLVVALAAVLDYDTCCEAFPAPEPTHVAAQAECDGAWLWMETTVPARLGEHPIDACHRLGITVREDIDG